MQFDPPLECGRLIRHYKRFLADIEMPDGNTMTLHCANTGAMTGCATPGDRVWYSASENPKRKYRHSWELTETAAGDWICVNTLRANALVEEALRANRISELAGYTQIAREVRYGEENSRIDLLLSDPKRADCYIEVKSVTLLQQQCGYFPDAVTVRGQKHLRELTQMAQQGKRAVLFFAVLHSGITQVRAARHIDPDYARMLTAAVQQGVEVICYQATLSAQGMVLNTPLSWAE